jgi:hypothetical protein
MNFKNWISIVESATRPGEKQGLYAPGYGGIGLYCPCDIINWGSDALTYMPAKDRVFKMNWGKGILSNPNPLEINKEVCFSEPPDLTGKFKMIWGKGILSNPN